MVIVAPYFFRGHKAPQPTRSAQGSTCDSLPPTKWERWEAAHRWRRPPMAADSIPGNLGQVSSTFHGNSIIYREFVDTSILYLSKSLKHGDFPGHHVKSPEGDGIGKPVRLKHSCPIDSWWKPPPSFTPRIRSCFKR